MMGGGPSGGMTANAILVAGCFWGMRDLISKCPGVISTQVGYIGGDRENARYRNHGARAHTIETTFDSGRTSYRGCSDSFPD